MLVAVTALAAAAAAVEDGGLVPQWGRFELNWTQSEKDLPANPFLVDLNVTFTLRSPSAPQGAQRPWPRGDHRAQRAGSLPDPVVFGDGDMPAAAAATKSAGNPPGVTLPTPLVALDFEIAGGDGGASTPNLGTTNVSCPLARLVSVSRTPDVPAGADGQAIDLGNDTTQRHVAVLGSGADGSKPFHGLAGLRQFTITGWLHVSGSDVGAGGNRVVNYCAGGGGVDLVWVGSAAGGQLKLSVNEWPDGTHPTSSPGTVPVGAVAWPRWAFFAVTYDADAPTGTDSVVWYFGDSATPAAQDRGATNAAYSRGAVQDPLLPLAFGNFGPGFHANDRVLRGKLYRPRVFATALTPAEVVAAQDRSGCRPRCDGRACGPDGCGGSCGPECGEPRTCNTATGRCELPTTLTVGGFYDGTGTIRARFSPPRQGVWSWSSSSSLPALSGREGTLTATAPAAGDHGPVESRGYGLFHADGTPHFSVGTTCYQWSSKDLDMQAATLDTLRGGPDGKGPVFNKIRMTVFPKWYTFNHANPVQVGTAYEIMPGSVAANATAWNCVGQSCPSTAGSFDLTRFNVSYWQNFERLVTRLHAMGVVADVIVFHPYDNGHWGFDCMGGRDPQTYNTSNDKFYLKYLAARLGAFSNVWWAMANEWSFCQCKSRGINASHLQSPSPVWDDLFRTLAAADPYGRQTSIHNGNLLYNHSRPWITHVSLQGLEDNTPAIREQYRKPVIWDEVRYEGDIPDSWGALSGEEEADRFWWGASLGVYAGHSETILRAGVATDDDQPLWWAKGGTLVGESPTRIRWFRELWTTNFSGAFAGVPDFGSLQPTQTSDGNQGDTVANVLSAPRGGFALWHFAREGRWNVSLPGGPAACSSWSVVLVDYWNVRLSNGPAVPRGAPSVAVEVEAIPFNVAIGCSSTVGRETGWRMEEVAPRLSGTVGLAL